MDEREGSLVDPLQVVDREQHGTGRRERSVRPLEDTEWVARLLPSASEHQLTEIPAGSRDVLAQIRYRHPAAPARITPLEASGVKVEFVDPQPAVTPGQAAVFYDGDAVVGGGWID